MALFLPTCLCPRDHTYQHDKQETFNFLVLISIQLNVGRGHIKKAKSTLCVGISPGQTNRDRTPEGPPGHQPGHQTAPITGPGLPRTRADHVPGQRARDKRGPNTGTRSPGHPGQRARDNRGPNTRTRSSGHGGATGEPIPRGHPGTES